MYEQEKVNIIIPKQIYRYMTVNYMAPNLVLFMRWRMVETVCKQMGSRLLPCSFWPVSFPLVINYNHLSLDYFQKCLKENFKCYLKERGAMRKPSDRSCQILIEFHTKDWCKRQRYCQKCG